MTFVSKTISGRDLIANEFTFELRELDGTPLLTGTNTAQGKVIFNGNLEFDKVGTYYYNIVETSADSNGVVTDKTNYRVAVTVIDTNGQLTASYTVVNSTDNSITFKNTYSSENTTFAISGTKELTGRVILNDEFTFILTEALNADGDIAEGAKAYEARNRTDGGFTFPEITYTKTGTYYYVVSEKQNSGSTYGIRYDTTEYIVAVTVTGNTQIGKLEASASLTATDIKFCNIYQAAPISESIPGNKLLNGKALTLGQFSFRLWKSNSDWTYAEASPLQTVVNAADGSFAFSFVDYLNGNATEFTRTGTYYYLINELNGGSVINGITYDATVYRVRVDITDDLLGQLHATVHIYDDAGVPQGNIVFTNIFTPAPEDITVDITVEKTITNKGSESIGPEGFEFVLENLETQEKQALETDENGKVIFTLEYTEDDIGNTYTYKLTETNGGIANVQYSTAEYNLTVTVALNENNELVASLTCNGEDVEAIVAEFENVYDYTPQPPDMPDIPDTPVNPPTGDITNLPLWFALLFVSGVGIFSTVACGRKRKED